jgi:hypothetical protein
LQLKALVTQSFEVFNVFGKEPEAIKNIINSFMIVLEDQSLEDINYGFREWLRISSVMPTPADIRELATGEADHKRKYAARAVPAASVAPTPLPKTPTVPWRGLNWNQFTDADREALAEHLAGMEPKKAQAYRWYLHEFCGAPEPERMGL